jgi:hypothetical protein
MKVALCLTPLVLTAVRKHKFRLSPLVKDQSTVVTALQNIAPAVPASVVVDPERCLTPLVLTAVRKHKFRLNPLVNDQSTAESALQNTVAK